MATNGRKQANATVARQRSIQRKTDARDARKPPKTAKKTAVQAGPRKQPDRPAKDVAKFGESSDMHRPAQPEEIAPAYVFLASPACASYISGIILPVMGGPNG